MQELYGNRHCLPLTPPACRSRYYAALRPCTHYLPIWQDSEDDVLVVLRALRGSPASDALAQRLAANAQAFALTWLSLEGQLRYWQLLIDQYASLYRGAASPDTLAAKALAEQQGRAASKAGSDTEDRCLAEGRDELECWSTSWHAMAAAWAAIRRGSSTPAAAAGAAEGTAAAAAAAAGADAVAEGTAEKGAEAGSAEAAAADAGGTEAAAADAAVAAEAAGAGAAAATRAAEV